jgi:hypothetical protein
MEINHVTKECIKLTGVIRIEKMERTDKGKSDRAVNMVGEDSDEGAKNTI